MGQRVANSWRAPVPLPVVEWGLMLLVLLALGLWFLREIRHVQGQSELSSIVGVVGNLRTGLTLDYLRSRAQPDAQPKGTVSRNPFGLLAHPPYNYRGEMTQAEAYRQVPGSWVYARDCDCVGYLPQYPQWLESGLEDSVLWLEQSGDVGLRSLNFRERYRWQGQAVDISQR